jgi:hypothetical protein
MNNFNSRRFVKLVFCIGPSRLNVIGNVRFLHTALPTQPLLPEQQDYLTYQQAVQAVESEIHRKDVEYTRFQDLWSAGYRRETELETNSDLRVHLNPIRIWAHFVTPVLLKGEADLPAEVLFFAAEDVIRATLLDGKARALLKMLDWFGPCTVKQFWMLNQHSGRTDIVRFCRDLARIGLVAFSA